jgi:hypothetical protein
LRSFAEQRLVFPSALALAVTFTVVATFAGDGRAGPGQTFTVIDRTVVCDTAFEGGVPDRLRSLWVGAGSESGRGPAELTSSITVGTGSSSSLSSSLVYVQADSASPSGPGPWLQVNRRRCKTIKTSVRPAREERTAAAIDFRADCKLLDAPPRILIRLRASMQSPTRWSVYKREFLVARSKPLDASVTVRTYPSRKPLAFASFDRSGAARFFAVPRCRE